MNWLHWWIPQFIISGFIWVYFAPSLGAALLSALKIDDKYSPLKPHLEFLFGFGIVASLASLLFPLHQAGLLLLILGLSFFKFKYGRLSQFKLHRSDIAVLLPLLIGSICLPTAIDNNLTVLQFSVNHDFWPIDWANRLEIHNSLTVLINYWFKETPLVNSLSVQCAFLGLVIWRGLQFCWSVVSLKKMESRDKWILAIIYFGSLYYRKQLHVKASPIGGLFALVFCFLASQNTKWRHPILLGLLMAFTLFFGEYGCLILIPIVALSIFSKSDFRNPIIDSLPWFFSFISLEVARKIFIFTHGRIGITAGAFLITLALAFVLDKIKSQIKNILPTFTNLEWVVALALAAVAIVSNLAYPMAGGTVEGMSFWKWSFGTNGILLLMTFYFLWKNRSENWARLCFLFSATQFLFFAAFHLVVPTHIIDYFNPTLLWWNLEKNSIMIAWPLLSVLLGSLYLSGIRKKIVLVPILIFFTFLQDPLVRMVQDGPFAPHAPRLSVFQSFYEMYWNSVRTMPYSSKSGNLVISFMGLDVPNQVEEVFKIQKASPKVLNVCLNELEPNSFAYFDMEAYTLGYLTGAKAHYKIFPNDPPCDLNIRL